MVVPFLSITWCFPLKFFGAFGLALQVNFYIPSINSLVIFVDLGVCIVPLESSSFPSPFARCFLVSLSFTFLGGFIWLLWCHLVLSSPSGSFKSFWPIFTYFLGCFCPQPSLVSPEYLVVHNRRAHKDKAVPFGRQVGSLNPCCFILASCKVFHFISEEPRLVFILGNKLVVVVFQQQSGKISSCPNCILLLSQQTVFSVILHQLGPG